MEVAYFMGWRPPSELLTRQWRHVNFVAGWLRLDPRITKNENGLNFPFTSELRDALEAQREYVRGIEQLNG